jgi:hypothetical protein
LFELLKPGPRRLLAAYVGPDDGQDEAWLELAIIHQLLPNIELWVWSKSPCRHAAFSEAHYLDAPPTWPEAVGIYELVEQLQEPTFDAVLILSAPGYSPHPIAYACYLAGIALRFGQSREFGGSVLSHWVKSRSDVSPAEHYLHLLEGLGLIINPAIAQSQISLVPMEDA